MKWYVKYIFRNSIVPFKILRILIPLYFYSGSGWSYCNIIKFLIINLVYCLFNIGLCILFYFLIRFGYVIVDGDGF